MEPRHEPTIESLLSEKIDLATKSLGDRLTATERNIGRRLDQQDDTLREIKVQTTKTNGRVTALERARERTQGAMAAYRWVPDLLKGLVTAAFGAGLTILVLALQGAIH